MEKIIPILKQKIQEDIKEYGKTKSRTLSMWTDLINLNLNGSQAKIRNNSETASIFKKLEKIFEFRKDNHCITFDGIRKSKVFYRLELK